MAHLIDDETVAKMGHPATPTSFDQSNITSLSEAVKHGARIIGVGEARAASFHLPQQLR
jgi:hypothetical protein